jgi:hypothetical protein
VSSHLWNEVLILFVMQFLSIIEKNKTTSVSFSPQANYSDWATVACRRNLVPTFADRELSRGHRSGSPTVFNLSFLGQSLYFQVAAHLSSRGWVEPVPDPQLLRESGSAGNRTHDLWVSIQEHWPLDYRAVYAVPLNMILFKYIWDQNCNA